MNTSFKGKPAGISGVVCLIPVTLQFICGETHFNRLRISYLEAVDFLNSIMKVIVSFLIKIHSRDIKILWTDDVSGQQQAEERVVIKTNSRAYIFTPVK